MTIKEDYTCFSAPAGNARLDKFLALALPAYSRAILQRVIAAGGVLVNGAVCAHAAQSVSPRAEVAVEEARLAAELPSNDACAPEALPLQVVYEDESLLIINKPPGLVTHPGHGNRAGTLQSGLLHHHAGAAALARGGIVHRLDKDTSGLLAAAKTAPAQKHLIAQFKTRQIGREYQALVYGRPPATGAINYPLRRSRRNALRMEAAAGGREALTYFKRERQWRGFALLHCRLQTGRTHQIRAHLERFGHPIVGDRLYCRRAAPLPFAVGRQMLHAAALRLVHPRDDTPREWQCPPPDDMQAVMAKFDGMQEGR